MWYGLFFSPTKTIDGRRNEAPQVKWRSVDTTPSCQKVTHPAYDGEGCNTWMSSCYVFMVVGVWAVQKLSLAM